MKRSEFSDILYGSPVIAAVRDEDGFQKALASECQVLFFMCGTLCTIGAMTKEAKKQGKTVFVHLDLVEGLGHQSPAAIDFLMEQAAIDGIISTKAGMIAYAKKKNLLAIQRYFLLDSLSLNNLLSLSSSADAIEILPAVLPKIFRWVLQRQKLQLIAGGLVSDKEDIVSILNAGAVAVSTSNSDLWMA